ncbi:MAG TPA: SRPBCC domain-containing protein [Polyangiaceae bacterium]|nr:SRPBCC domain-containing protein [Polyangiaceae bacterium]
MKNRSTAERKSERELVVTRTFNGPVRIVFEAWANPELFRRWWVPKSVGVSLLSCEMDVRTGGGYRLVMGVGPSQTMAFHGKYLEVIPNSRIVWTNEEAGEGGPITTVTFRGESGQDAARRERALSLEGGARRSHRLWRAREERVLRPTGRASRYPGRLTRRCEYGSELELELVDATRSSLADDSLWRQ